MKKLFFLLLFVFLIVGCKTVEQSLTNYKTCIDDPQCHALVDQSQQTTYAFTKGAVSNVMNNPIADGIALIVSNIVAFGVGVYKGKKRQV